MHSSLLRTLLACAAFAPATRADVTLPQIFAPHAVLQKSDKTPVWGKADPGEKVRVEFGTVRRETVAGADGAWKVTLPLEQSGPGPFELKVTGKNLLVLPDILVGQVWFCSGQSNMEWALQLTLDGKAAAASPNAQLRLFHVRSPGALSPQEKLLGRPNTGNAPQNQWNADAPQASANFSAVAYYFGRALQEKLNQPVGLINASWGGTPLEAWASDEAFHEMPELKEPKDKIVEDLRLYAQRTETFRTLYRAWEAKYQRADHPAADPAAFATPCVSTEGWVPVTLPGNLPADTLPASGAIWLRRTVQIPPAQAGKALTILPGALRGFDQVYWNGKRAGETTPDTPGAVNNRVYRVPADLVHEGEATIAIRLFVPAGNAGSDMSRTPQWMSPIRLSGQWLAKAEYTLPPLDPEAIAACPRQPSKPCEMQNAPTALFNGMVHPLLPYGIRGILWYQGETNTGRSWQYRQALPMLIRDWRKQWSDETLPFYICQLAGQGPKKSAIEKGDNWSELREAQAMALSLPHTGLAVLHDLSEDNVHFRNKKPAGERLVALALARTYGQPIPCSGPVYEAMQKEGHQIRIRFRHTDGGLAARPLPEKYLPDTTNPASAISYPLCSPGSPLQGFAICGEDQKWQWAQAKVDGDSVLVWSDQVKTPVAVRYAWGVNPTANLYNGTGFPAAPFRTDTFPEISRTWKLTSEQP